MAQAKVCIVTHTFLPHVGGIERVVYEQSKRVRRKHYQPTVLTSRMGTAKAYYYDGIPVKCYDSLSLGFRLGIPYPIPKISSLSVFLESVKSSDLIHAHGHPYLPSLVAAKLAKRYNKPLVLTQHNTFIEYNSRVWDNVEKLNDIAVGKQVLREAQKILVVSHATRNYVLSLGADPERVQVMHNGVDVDRFKPSQAARGETRRKLGVAEGEVVVLTVRRLVYKNGIDTFIESAQTAIKKNPRLVYVAVGKGPDMAEVQARVEQLGLARNVRLTGFVSDADLPAYYNAADLFVLPSKSGEGLPLVALEAMACGLPVVATAVGGIGEVMIQGFGWLVPANSPERMAEAVVDCSEMELSKLRDSLRKIMVARHGWDSNVERLVKIYEELI